MAVFRLKSLYFDTKYAFYKKNSPSALNFFPLKLIFHLKRNGICESKNEKAGKYGKIIQFYSILVITLHKI